MTGIALIDDDHRAVLALLNQLFDAREEGQARDVVSSILNILLEYQLVHFEHEQRLMAFCHYEKLHDHLTCHAKFVAVIAEFLRQYDDCRSGALDDLISFLKNWLVDHVASGDTHLWSIKIRGLLSPDRLQAVAGGEDVVLS